MKRSQLVHSLKFIILVLGITACGLGGMLADPTPSPPPEESNPAGSRPTAPDEREATAPPVVSPPAAAAEQIELELWHSLEGQASQLLDGFVTRFNEGQARVTLKASFKGDDDALYAAFQNALAADTAPNLVQIDGIATQSMLDTDQILPLHQLVEGQDEILWPLLHQAYSDDDGLAALPLRIDIPLIYYNGTMFKLAGLDVPRPDWTFTGFKAVCDQLLGAQVTPQCFAYNSPAGYFGWLLANSGGLYFNQNNGYTGRPTEVVFNQETGPAAFIFLASLGQEGYAHSPLSPSQIEQAFLEQQVALVVASGTQFSPDIGNRFQILTATLPHSDGSPQPGPHLDSDALWIVDAGRPADNEAAGEFLKFLLQPAQQIVWHTGSGYLPIRTDLGESPELTDFWQEQPLRQAAYRHMAAIKAVGEDGQPNYPALGGRVGPFPEIRLLLDEAYRQVQDGSLTPQAALDQAARQANEIVADYNASLE